MILVQNQTNIGEMKLEEQQIEELNRYYTLWKETNYLHKKAPRQAEAHQTLFIFI